MLSLTRRRGTRAFFVRKKCRAREYASVRGKPERGGSTRPSLANLGAGHSSALKVPAKEKARSEDDKIVINVRECCKARLIPMKLEQATALVKDLTTKAKPDVATIRALAHKYSVDISVISGIGRILVRMPTSASKRVGTDILLASSAAGNATATLALSKIALNSGKLYVQPYLDVQRRVKDLVGSDTVSTTVDALVFLAKKDLLGKNIEGALNKLDRAIAAFKSGKVPSQEKSFDDHQANFLFGIEDPTYEGLDDPWYIKATILQSLNQHDKARKAFQSSAEIADNVEAYHALSQYELRDARVEGSQVTEKWRNYTQKAAVSGSPQAMIDLWHNLYGLSKHHAQKRLEPALLRHFDRVSAQRTSIFGWRWPLPYWIASTSARFFESKTTLFQSDGLSGWIKSRWLSLIGHRGGKSNRSVVWGLEWLALASTFPNQLGRRGFLLHTETLARSGFRQEAADIARQFLDKSNRELLPESLRNGMNRHEVQLLESIIAADQQEIPLSPGHNKASISQSASHVQATRNGMRKKALEPGRQKPAT